MTNKRPYWQVAVSLLFSIAATVGFILIGWKLLGFLMPFVVGWIIASIATPQQRGDAALGDAQMLRQLGQGVTAAVQAAQLQDIQGPGQGTVGISGRHGTHFLSLYIGPLRGIRTRSGKRRKCSDVFRTGILKTPDVFGYRAILELAFRYLNKNCALSGSDGGKLQAVRPFFGGRSAADRCLLHGMQTLLGPATALSDNLINCKRLKMSAKSLLLKGTCNFFCKSLLQFQYTTPENRLQGAVCFSWK